MIIILFLFRIDLKRVVCINSFMAVLVCSVHLNRFTPSTPLPSTTLCTVLYGPYYMDRIQWRMYT